MPAINILSLCSGSQDILWVGSDGQGIIGIYDDGIAFNKVPNSRLFDARSCPVRSFYRDAGGNLYVGTKGNGICMLRPDGTRGAAYDVSRGLSNNFVYSLAEGYDGDMFIGHDGAGLDVLSFSTGRISTVKPAEGARFGSVYAILRDSENGCLWLGTNGYGLIRLQLRPFGGQYVVQSRRYTSTIRRTIRR